MDKVKVSKQVINFIVPFTFKMPYNQAFDKLKSSSTWQEIKSSQRENMMEHIDNLIRRNPEKKQRETIGRHYELSQNGRVAREVF